jgi:hypothetical protein
MLPNTITELCPIKIHTLKAVANQKLAIMRLVSSFPEEQKLPVLNPAVTSLKTCALEMLLTVGQ